MNKNNRNIYYPNKMSVIYLILIFSAILIYYSFAEGKSKFNELISLKVENKPLVEVLDDVSKATGYELIIDEIWADLPVTVRFDNLPLDQALKLILANVNNAIIYGSDGKILINIYEKNSSKSRHSDYSRINPIPREPIFQHQDVENSSPPSTYPQFSGDIRDEYNESNIISRQPEQTDEEAEEEKDESKKPDEDNDDEDDDELDKSSE